MYAPWPSTADVLQLLIFSLKESACDIQLALQSYMQPLSNIPPDRERKEK